MTTRRRQLRFYIFFVVRFDVLRDRYDVDVEAVQNILTVRVVYSRTYSERDVQKNAKRI